MWSRESIGLKINSTNQPSRVVPWEKYDIRSRSIEPNVLCQNWLQWHACLYQIWIHFKMNSITDLSLAWGRKKCNTFRLEQNGRHFAGDIFNCIARKMWYFDWNFTDFFPMIPFMAWPCTPDNQLYELYTHSYSNIVVNKINIQRVWYHFLRACVTIAGIRYSLRIWLWRHHQNIARASETRGMMFMNIILWSSFIRGILIRSLE